MYITFRYKISYKIFKKFTITRCNIMYKNIVNNNIRVIITSYILFTFIRNKHVLAINGTNTVQRLFEVLAL